MRPCSKLTPAALGGLPAVLTLWFAAPATSETVTTNWLTAAPGNFGDPRRWTSGVPGPSDTAQFGATWTSTPFDVIVTGSHTVAGLSILTQSPSFVAGVPDARGGSAEILVNGAILIGSPVNPTPVVHVTGVGLHASQFAWVGFASVGGLIVGDATVGTHQLSVGSSGGFGWVQFEADGHLALDGPTASAVIGENGSGSVLFKGGSTCDIGGSTVTVGAGSQSGTGSLSVDSGATVDLAGGAIDAGNVGTGTILVDGTLRGPGTIRLGLLGKGTLTLGSAGTLDDLDSIDIVIGAKTGSNSLGTLVLEQSFERPSIHVGELGAGSLRATGSGVDVSFGTMLLGKTNAAGSVEVSDGAALDVGAVSLNGPSGTLLVDDATLTVSAFSFGATTTQALIADIDGPLASAELPAIALGNGRTLDLSANAGAQVSMGGIAGAAGSTVILQADHGASIDLLGDLTVAGTSVAQKVVIGAGARVSAASVTTSAACPWTWTLPVAEPALSATNVALDGPIVIATEPGWQPAQPGDIRLVSASEIAVALPPVATPVAFGYPSLFAVDADGAVLKLIDHIDRFELPARLTVPFGAAVSLPSSIVFEGVSYDVSSQVSWSFEPSDVMLPLSGVTFVAAKQGAVSATVTFGLSSATTLIQVTGGPQPFAIIASAGANGLGNDDSGWDGPGLFVDEPTLGPRSMSADGAVVSFGSRASNLAEPDPLHTLDAFVKDLDGGEIVELTAPAGTQGFALADAPVVSGDGRYVLATVGSPAPVWNAFLYDRTAGTKEIVAFAMDGSPATLVAEARVALSDDARFIAFGSVAGNIAPDDTNAVADVFLRDRVVGTTQRVSLAPDGSQFIGACQLADMTSDGRYTLFLRSIGSYRLAYRFDRLTGEVRIASPGLIDDTPSILVKQALLTDDGRSVLFLAQTSEPIVNGPQPSGAQIYLCDVDTGTVSPGCVVQGSDGGWEWPGGPIEGFAADRSTRWIAFTTKAGNVLPSAAGSGDGRSRLYRLDRLNGQVRHLSESMLSGTPVGFNDDVYGALSVGERGLSVAFVTRATNLTVVDTADHNDVFVSRMGDDLWADLDGDGVVGAGDLAVLLGAWGSPSLADLDGDGVIGAGDIALLLGAWSA